MTRRHRGILGPSIERLPKTELLILVCITQLPAACSPRLFALLLPNIFSSTTSSEEPKKKFYLFGWQQRWCHGFTSPCVVEFLSTRIRTSGDFENVYLSLVLVGEFGRNGSLHYTERKLQIRLEDSEEFVPKAHGDRS